VTDPSGAILRYDYDAAGDLVGFTDAVGVESSFAYDADHRVVDYTDANGDRTVSEYDADGRWLGVRDVRGGLAAFEYDLDNRIVTTTNSPGQPTTREYDNAGNVVREIDANGAEWSYTHDSDGNRLTETTPLGHTTTWEYDFGGNVVRKTDPLGNVVESVRDAAGRIVERVDSTGAVEQIEYDARGNRTLRRDPEGHETRWSYDTRGQVSQVEHPDGLVETFEYDGTGVATALVDATGNRLEIDRDAAGRPTLFRNALGQETVVDYDAEGREISRTDPLGRTTSYELDGNGRRTATTHPDGNVKRFVYDASGRRETRTENGLGVTEYSWDLDGRLTGRDERFVGGRSFDYLYDPDGVRVAVVEDGIERRLLVDGNRPLAEVIEEYLPSGAALASYVLGLAPISIESGTGDRRLYGTDRHSGVRFLTDLAGVVTDSYAYDAFGRIESASGSFGNRRLYRGEFQDAETGLQYLRARWYDPRTGGFLSPDPRMGRTDAPASLHRYLYGNANPIRFADPSGETSTLVDVSLSTAVVGILSTMVSAVQLTGSHVAGALFDKSAGMRSQDVRWEGVLGTVDVGILFDVTGSILEVDSNCLLRKNGRGGTYRRRLTNALVGVGAGLSAEVSAGGVNLRSPGNFGHGWLVLSGAASIWSAAADVGPSRTLDGSTGLPGSLGFMFAGSGFGNTSGPLDGVALSAGFSGGVSIPIYWGTVEECGASR
jgi:RHS repeat-associated protein